MDSISDMLTQIRNALAVKKAFISLPHSNFKQSLAEKMLNGNYLKAVSKIGRGPIKFLKIELKYDEKGIPAVSELKKISKPGRRVYSGKTKLKPVRSGLGKRIISTSNGLMFDDEARKNNLGGEVICEIF